jgi:RNA polymerase sigma-B factor
MAVSLRSPPPAPRSAVSLRARRDFEHRLLVRYHVEDDVASREQLVARLLPFARELARRYANSGEPMDDLFQVASLGLIKAIDRFEPERGTKFTSFAAPTILGELKRYLRDKGWALHVSRDVQERALAVSRADEKLSKELGRSPSVREIAAALECCPERVLEAREAATAYHVASLEAPALRDDGESSALAELVGRDDPGYEQVGRRDAIATTWRSLSDIQREVLRLRFAENLTQREIGARIGYSQMHVSRLMRAALLSLGDEAAA